VVVLNYPSGSNTNNSQVSIIVVVQVRKCSPFFLGHFDRLYMTLSNTFF